MQHKVPFVILVLLILALLTSIFLFSNQDGDDSSTLSRIVSERLAFTMNPSYMNAAKESIRNQVIRFLIHPVRKLAHFGEYALLGGLLMGAMLCLRLGMSLKMLLSLLISAVCAVADEFHQTFISGRSGQPSDVLIDTCGALCGILLVWVLTLAVLYGVGRRRLHRASRRKKGKKKYSGYMAAPPPDNIR